MNERPSTIDSLLAHGLFDRLLIQLDHPDLLLILNLMETYKQLSQLPHGFYLLQKISVLEPMFQYLSLDIPMNYDRILLFCTILKCISHIACYQVFHFSLILEGSFNSYFFSVWINSHLD